MHSLLSSYPNTGSVDGEAPGRRPIRLEASTERSVGAPPQETAVPALWDRYLDVADAEVLLHAVAELERLRAVREPLPLGDLDDLLARLQVVAGIARDEAIHWQLEARERRLEAGVDGGRWGTPQVARQMTAIAEELAAGSTRIAEVAQAATEDLAPRLGPSAVEAVRVAEAATAQEIERLLQRLRTW